MKSVTGKDLRRVLERNDWELVRIRGKHHIYGKQGSNVRLSIPIHGNAPLKIGLLNHLLKSAALSESDL
jgi:predicted RNA binding protein YcfA (HicA-like mRNA interferase family)